MEEGAKTEVRLNRSTVFPCSQDGRRLGLVQCAPESLHLRDLIDPWATSDAVPRISWLISYPAILYQFIFYRCNNGDENPAQSRKAGISVRLLDWMRLFDFVAVRSFVPMASGTLINFSVLPSTIQFACSQIWGSFLETYLRCPRHSTGTCPFEPFQ